MFKFCWHKWGRWSKVIQDFNGNLHQVSECEKCGAIKRRCAVSMWFAQLGSEQVNDAVKERS
jgi:hypothetical protein